MKFSDVMIDIETLGTDPKAVVLSVGLVAFNLGGDTKPVKTEIRFGQKQFREEQKRVGRKVDQGTVRWWKKQSEEAKAIFHQTNVVDMDHACRSITHFFGQNTDERNVRVWGNGAGFDNVIVGSLLTDFGYSQPWKFWNDRCHRTFKSQFKALVPEIEFTGVPHNAADDAEHQVKVLQAIHSRLVEWGAA